MAAQTQGLRDVVELEPNRPVEVALAFPTGKTVNGIHGQRVMFSLADGRVMFLDLGQAQRINDLKVKPREPFTVCLQWSGRRGEAKEFVAWLSPESEKGRAMVDAQANGDTWTARKLGKSIERERSLKAAPPIGTPVGPGDGKGIVERAAAAAADGAKAPAMIDQVFGQRLLARADSLIDVFAGAMNYARKHGDQVGAEDVRWFVIAAYLGEAGKR